MQTVEYRVLHSGHVEKQRVNAKLLNTKKWRRRYLELHPTTLVWFREGTEKKGYIFLNAETEVQEWPPTLGHAGAIMVRSPQDNRALSFRCSSMDEHREWFHHISAVVEQAVQRSSAEGKKVTRRVSVSFAANGEVPGQRSSVRASRAVVDDNDSDDGSDEGGDEVGQSLGSEAEGRLLAVAGNSTCADCVTSDPAHFPNTPAWGSTNLGCVFCIRCSGVHRKLGAHVSKVLSLRIDTWSEEQLHAMEAKGNGAVNAELEAEVPSNVEKPDLAASSMEELEAWIRAKYELGSFRPGGDGFVPHVRAKSASVAGMIEFAGLLFIRLVQATDLPSSDAFGKTDAFCEFQLGDRKCRSKTCKGSSNPRWGESLSLNSKSLNETLIVKVFHQSLNGAAFLGQCCVALASLKDDGSPKPVQLALETGKPRTSRFSRSAITRSPTVSLELTYNALDR